MPIEPVIGALPVGWTYTTLAEACALGGGGIQTGPFGSQLHKSDYVSQGVPSIMPTNIGDNKINTEGIARISPADAQRLSRYLVRAGDIVYSRRGDVEKRALIREPEDGWLCGTGCLRVRLGDTGPNSKYISYYLGHPEVRAWIVRHAHGATMPNLNTSILGALPLAVPPRCEQERIAEALGALDEKIELNRRMSETLEEISATFFKAWLQDSGIGQGPVEGTLADIIEFDPPERLRRGVEAPYLGLAHIPNSGMIHEAPDTRAYTSGARFRDGDTLFARITPSLENGKTAIALGLGSNTIAWGSTELIVMRPKKPVPALVPYLISRDPSFRAHAVQNMSGTSGRQRVPREALMRYAFPARSHQDWQHLNRLLSPVAEAVWTRAQESRTLAELRDALLPKLVSGELRIPEAEQLVSEVA